MVMVVSGSRSRSQPTPAARAVAHAAEAEVQTAAAAAAMAAESGALHERLVAYVHSLGATQMRRDGVWKEHSYARADDAGARQGRGAGERRRDVRVLLAVDSGATAAAAAAARGDVDVGGPGDERGGPRSSALPCDDDDTDDEAQAGAGAGADEGAVVDDDWWSRVRLLATQTAQARAADEVCDVLRRLRLARLAAPLGRARRHEQARIAARRLRRALASSWCNGVGAWVSGAVSAYAPRDERALFDEVLHELTRQAPRLAKRLQLPNTQARKEDPLAPPCDDDATAVPRPAAGGPWLAWLSVGSAQCARWERRLRALVPLRVLRASCPPAPAAPDVWCGAALHSLRAQLDEFVAEATSLGADVVVGGCGCAASLAAALAGALGAGRGGREARGRQGPAALALVAPHLHTAEGAWDSPDDALHEVSVPVLLVCGGCGGRGAALEAAGGGAGARRVLVVDGADALLRLPARARIAKNLPAHALDAAIADEVVRWAIEACEAKAGEDVTEDSDAGSADAERDANASVHAHAHAQKQNASAAQSTRSIEIVEGRVVSRVSGGTPLQLLPPRRLQPSPSAPPPPSPAPALGAADILQLPIVFADDPAPTTTTTTTSESAATPPKPLQTRIERTSVVSDSSAAPATVTATSVRAGGTLKYTRVIVAKRGGPAASRPRALLVRRAHTATSTATAAPLRVLARGRARP